MLLKRVPKGEADERDNDQMTPLHWSASYGNAEHVKLLLKAASSVTLIDEQSRLSSYSHCTCTYMLWFNLYFSLLFKYVFQTIFFQFFFSLFGGF